MGKADVERHISTPMHVSNAKATKSPSTLTFHSVSTPIDEKVNQYIYNSVADTGGGVPGVGTPPSNLNMNV